MAQPSWSATYIGMWPPLAIRQRLGVCIACTASWQICV
jgi:hypothetical protein